MHSLTYFSLALVACIVQGQHVTVNVASPGDLIEFADEVKLMFETHYPTVRMFLLTDDYVEPNQITLQFREDLTGVNAYTYPTRNRIVASAEYYRHLLHDESQNQTVAHDMALGSLFHELVHVVQQYKNCPSWIYEGIADSLRYLYFHSANPSYMPTKPLFKYGNHYSSGFRSAAYFIDWLNQHRNYTGDEALETKLNEVCRAGTYSDQIFNDLFKGNTKDQLWEEMIYSPSIRNFTVLISNDPVHPDDPFSNSLWVKHEMINIYKNMSQLLYSPTYEDLDVIYLDFQQDLGDIHFNAGLKAIRADPIFIGDDAEQDILIPFFYAMARVIQQYKLADEWLASGIARLAVATVYPEARKYLKHTPGLHYTDGDWEAAYFLNYLNRRYRPQGKPLSYWLNKKLRENTYTESDFQMYTGRPVQMLWNQMMATF